MLLKNKETKSCGMWVISPGLGTFLNLYSADPGPGLPKSFHMVEGLTVLRTLLWKGHSFLKCPGLKSFTCLSSTAISVYYEDIFSFQFFSLHLKSFVNCVALFLPFSFFHS